MGRKANKTAIKSDFKSGDLVLIAYKKYPLWPCVVKCVYPKKITYNFLPMVEKAAVFSADNKAVKPFDVHALKDYKDSSNEEFKEACDAAMLLFSLSSNNVSSGQTNNKLDDEETSGDSLSETSGKGIKQTDKVEKTTKNGNEPTILEAEKPNSLIKSTFRKGDSVLVKCANGMWPAAFCSYNNDEAIVQTFPLEENEPSIVNVEDVAGLSPEYMKEFHLSKLEDTYLVKALKAVQVYWNEGQDVKLATDSSFVEAPKLEQLPKKDAQKTKINPKKFEAKSTLKKEDSNSLKGKKTLGLAKFRLKASEDAVVKSNNVPAKDFNEKSDVAKVDQEISEDPDLAMAPAVKVTKNKIFDELEAEPKESLRPKRAVKKLVSPVLVKSKALKKEETIVLPNIEDKTNNMPTYESISSNSIADVPIASKSQVTTRKRRAAEVLDNDTGGALKPNEKQAVNKRKKNDSSESLKSTEEPPVVITDEDVKQSEKAKLVEEWLQNSVDNNGTTENSLVAKMGNNFANLVISDEAKEFMNKIWNSYSTNELCENSHFCLPKREQELSFEFKTGNLLTPVELEKSVSTISKWIKLCTVLPKMNVLVELRYIVNFVLPELCVFGISKSRNVSMDVARKLFIERISEQQMNAKKVDANSAVLLKENKKKNNNSTTLHEDIANIRDSSIPSSSSAKNTAMECLILAATLEAEKNINSTNMTGSSNSVPVELPEMTSFPTLNNKKVNNR